MAELLFRLPAVPQITALLHTDCLLYNRISGYTYTEPKMRNQKNQINAHTAMQLLIATVSCPDESYLVILWLWMKGYRQKGSFHCTTLGHCTGRGTSIRGYGQQSTFGRARCLQQTKQSWKVHPESGFHTTLFCLSWLDGKLLFAHALINYTC